MRNTDTNSSPSEIGPFVASVGDRPLAIALIGPNDDHRLAAVKALTSCGGSEIFEYSTYPQGLGITHKILQESDAIVIDLDSDREAALRLVENSCTGSAATVMVYSVSTDPALLMRCMRAGAREFLTLPFAPDAVSDAIARAVARRPAPKYAEKAKGKLFSFLAAKGGTGATTLACNFAVALAQEPSEKTLLIDLDLPLGDAGLNLGIAAEFSTIDALQAAERLDGRFLSQLLVKHASGVWVLAAPGKLSEYQASYEDIDRLMDVASREFDNVVVDMGSNLYLMETSAYKGATAVYLVTQASIPELRNSNRLISQFFAGPLPKLEIVINRFESRALGVSEEHITKALTRPAQWKIPNDFAAVRKMQINATPLVLEDSAITRQIRQMVNAVSPQDEAKAKANGKKKLFGIF